MTYEELRKQLDNLNEEELQEEVVVVSYGMNDGASTTEIELGDWTTTQLFIGAWFY